MKLVYIEKIASIKGSSYRSQIRQVLFESWISHDLLKNFFGTEFIKVGDCDDFDLIICKTLYEMTIVKVTLPFSSLPVTPL